jgi:hypothetical protein
VYQLHIHSVAATVALYNTIDPDNNVYYSTHPVRQVRRVPLASSVSWSVLAAKPPRRLEQVFSRQTVASLLICLLLKALGMQTSNNHH